EDARLSDVSVVVGGVLGILREELEAQGVTVRLELAGGLPQVRGDRIQLQQVVLNLVTNAVEAMSALPDRARVLQVATSLESPEHVVMTISDSGIGIDPKNVDRIFHPFF